MKLGYTIWSDYHYTHFLEILPKLKEIGVTTIAIVPQYLLDRDDRARLVEIYLPIRDTISAIRDTGFELMVKPHFVPRDSSGKMPSNWQGWVGTVKMNSWELLMGRIRLELESLAKDYQPEYLCLGSDLIGTHRNRIQWQDIITSLTTFNTSLVYGNTFWQPLLQRFRWRLFWSVLFGSYNRVLNLALPTRRFIVPDDQQTDVGRSIYRSGFRFSLDAVGLNLYWPPEDNKYDDIEEIWFNYQQNGLEINYVEATENWKGDNPLWITECDLVGPHRSDMQYYQKWWETCISVWGGRCELIMCHEQGPPQWIEMARSSSFIIQEVKNWRQEKKKSESEMVSGLVPNWQQNYELASRSTNHDRVNTNNISLEEQSGTADFQAAIARIDQEENRV
tara:strand:- start:1088 stop:2263 length:1176 start_codon:yes stop_codon:yes gene_type:complete